MIVQGPSMGEQKIEYKMIEELIIGDRPNIDLQFLRAINQLKSKNKMTTMRSMSEAFSKSNFFTTPILKNRMELLKLALKTYHDAKIVQLLQTGDFHIKESDKHVIFSQFCFGCLTIIKDSGIKYDGFVYRFEKFSYVGQFGIVKNSLVFDGEGESMERSEEGFVFLKGRWKNSHLREGIKQIYASQKLNVEGLKQSYKGTFSDMKYHGKGILRTKTEVKQGTFEYGKFIKRDEQPQMPQNNLQKGQY